MKVFIVIDYFSTDCSGETYIKGVYEKKEDAENVVKDLLIECLKQNPVYIEEQYIEGRFKMYAEEHPIFELYKRYSLNEECMEKVFPPILETWNYTDLREYCEDIEEYHFPYFEEHEIILSSGSFTKSAKQK